MIDTNTIFLILILVCLLYLAFKLSRSSVDEEKIKLKIESELTQKFQEHLNNSNQSFLSLADENFKSHNDVFSLLFKQIIHLDYKIFYVHRHITKN